MQRCWERSRHEVRIREQCTSSVSLNTWIFLEMLAEGESQARTGAERGLLPHRLSNSYGQPPKHVVVPSASVSPSVKCRYSVYPPWEGHIDEVCWLISCYETISRGF